MHNRIDAQKRISMTRGINENTNALLRQYLPKGADLSVLSIRIARSTQIPCNRGRQNGCAHVAHRR